jgi:hypothetical protein
MAINAGVWIDRHKAVILLITGAGEDMRQTTSRCAWEDIENKQ